MKVNPKVEISSLSELKELSQQTNSKVISIALLERLEDKIKPRPRGGNFKVIRNSSIKFAQTSGIKNYPNVYSVKKASNGVIMVYIHRPHPIYDNKTHKITSDLMYDFTRNEPVGDLFL